MELLAPAGDWAALQAAFANGADAVYMGGQHFNARQYATNFSMEQIVKAVEYARLRGKKIYITFNTLIDNQEFPAALDYAYSLYLSGGRCPDCAGSGLVKLPARAASRAAPCMPARK